MIKYIETKYEYFVKKYGEIKFECLNNEKKSKHADQQSSIIGHLLNLNALNQNNVFVEFGSGRGELMSLVQQLVAAEGYVVDKKNCRFKFATKTTTRLQIDIKDLDLKEAVPQKPIIAFSKHLCGSATDLTLRCLLKSGFKTAVIAVCCHQKCCPSSFLGLHQLKQDGLDELDLILMCKISSWAVSGGYQPKIGLKSKRVLDFLRVDFLLSMGYNARLVYYTLETTTLENCAIVSWEK